MSSPSTDGLKQEIDQGRMREGNQVQDQDGTPQTGTDLNAPMYVDLNSQLQIGGFPFALQLFGGVTNTANSALTIEGQSTGAANDLMHLTLVSGANATATIAGYYRVTVTDDAGNITTGAYYAPFYTLA